jgi:hypothetical protein
MDGEISWKGELYRCCFSSQGVTQITAWVLSTTLRKATIPVFMTFLLELGTSKPGASVRKGSKDALQINVSVPRLVSVPCRHFEQPVSISVVNCGLLDIFSPR